MSLFGRWLGGRTAYAPHADDVRVAPGERVYAIGDVHGRADLLLELLDRVADNAAPHVGQASFRIVFLGDYVDRGLESQKVLGALRRIRDTARTSVRFLIGNHEAAMLAFLDDPVRGAGWLSMGAFQTFESYGIQPPHAGAGLEGLVEARDRLQAALGEDERFLRWDLVRWFRSGSVIFVHAAVDPGLPMEAQPNEALLWGEAVGFRDERGLPGATVVHGHFVSDAPEVRPWRIGVDTGAYFSGRLTALWIGERDYGFISTSS